MVMVEAGAPARAAVEVVTAGVEVAVEAMVKARAHAGAEVGAPALVKVAGVRAEAAA